MLAETPCSWGRSSGGEQEARRTCQELQETERYQKSESGLSRLRGRHVRLLVGRELRVLWLPK